MRIERECSGRRPDRQLSIIGRRAIRECPPRGFELGGRELLAEREVAVAVEKPLHCVAELASSREPIVASELGGANTDRIELRRDLAIRCDP